MVFDELARVGFRQLQAFGFHNRKNLVEYQILKPIHRRRAGYFAGPQSGHRTERVDRAVQHELAPDVSDDVFDDDRFMTRATQDAIEMAQSLRA